MTLHGQQTLKQMSESVDSLVQDCNRLLALACAVDMRPLSFCETVYMRRLLGRLNGAWKGRSHRAVHSYAREVLSGELIPRVKKVSPGPSSSPSLTLTLH